MKRLTWPRCSHSFISCKIWYPKKNDNGSDVGVENCGLKTYCLNCMCSSCRSFFFFNSGMTTFMLFVFLRRKGVFFPVVLTFRLTCTWFPSVFLFSLCMKSKMKKKFNSLPFSQNNISRGKWIHLDSTKTSLPITKISYKSEKGLLNWISYM